MEYCAGKVLFVDDDPNILIAFTRALRKCFTVETALSGPEALALIESNGPYAVIVADILMPEMNGVELLAEVSRIAPDTVRVVLTADVKEQPILDSINQGHVFRFLDKPCPRDVLLNTLRTCLEQYGKNLAERTAAMCDSSAA